MNALSRGTAEISLTLPLSSLIFNLSISVASSSSVWRQEKLVPPLPRVDESQLFFLIISGTPVCMCVCAYLCACVRILYFY